jgi:hypothetical protein
MLRQNVSTPLSTSVPGPHARPSAASQLATTTAIETTWPHWPGRGIECRASGVASVQRDGGRRDRDDSVGGHHDQARLCGEVGTLGLGCSGGEQR